MNEHTATEALDAEIAGVDLLDLSHRDVQRLLAAAAAVPPPRQRLDIANAAGARAMSTALVLDADGRRKDGKWSYGSVAVTQRSESGTLSAQWKQRLAEAGIVLDHAPDLTEQVVNGDLALDAAYRPAHRAHQHAGAGQHSTPGQPTRATTAPRAPRTARPPRARPPRSARPHHCHRRTTARPPRGRHAAHRGHPKRLLTGGCLSVVRPSPATHRAEPAQQTCPRQAQGKTPGKRQGKAQRQSPRKARQ